MNFYCFSCERPRDSNDEDHADYSGEDPVCGDCMDELEEQLQQTWNQLDQDTQAIEDFCEETP